MGTSLIRIARLFPRYRHFECRQDDVDAVSEFVDAVKASARLGVHAGHVITVVGELFAGRQVRRFAHDFVAFDDEARAIAVNDDPFPPEQRDGAIRTILNRDEIDERVRFVRRQGNATMVIAEPVKAGG
jgi:hypothetical protein